MMSNVLFTAFSWNSCISAFSPGITNYCKEKQMTWCMFRMIFYKKKSENCRGIEVFLLEFLLIVKYPTRIFLNQLHLIVDNLQHTYCYVTPPASSLLSRSRMDRPTSVMLLQYRSHCPIPAVSSSSMGIGKTRWHGNVLT